MDTTPFWATNVEAPRFPALTTDLAVDVLVIGGGITGMTAAYLLTRAGRRVALIEREKIGSGQTGHTTAHITCVTDTRLGELVRKFGRNHAQAAWDAGLFAMNQIEEHVQEEGIDCELRRIPGYLFAAEEATSEERERLREEAALAAELGFDALYVDSAPVMRRPAIRFANQLKFHPLKYLTGLAQRVQGGGGQIFEETAAGEFSESTRSVRANGCNISFEQVLLTTHVPLQGGTGLASATLLQTKLAAYSTYAIGARLPSGILPEALFWDTADPYRYLRVDRREGHDYAVLGGKDHKTGQETDTEERFAELETILRGISPESVVDRRWSGQVIEPTDGLPYIGQTAEGQFVATGFGGNGMTFGTVGAFIIRDAILGLTNPWRELFSVDRKKLNALWDYLKENKDFPYYLVKQRLSSAEGMSIEEVGRDQGKILRLDGKKVAVYRDAAGQVTMLSPVCTHMGCIVAWNAAEKTWDCPCHGSRFHRTGEVSAGPAEEGLEAHSA